MRLTKTLALILIMFCGLFSQSDFPDTSFGIKLGMNISSAMGKSVNFLVQRSGGSFSNYSSKNYNTRTGFVGGVFFTGRVYNDFFFKTELLYSRKGFEREVRIDNDNHHYYKQDCYILDYIEIPMTIQYSIPFSGRIFSGLKLYCGLYFAHNHSADSKDYILWRDDVREIVRTEDYGTLFGLELIFQELFIEARYTVGLIDIFNQKRQSFYPNAKNSVVSITIGYSIINLRDKTGSVTDHTLEKKNVVLAYESELSSLKVDIGQLVLTRDSKKLYIFDGERFIEILLDVE